MNDKCPCIKCICRAICNGKNFTDLMGDCKLISDYYYFARVENFDHRLENIVKHLHPIWSKEEK